MTSDSDKELRKRVGLKIKVLRESRRMRRIEIAQSLGHKFQWLWDIESGRRMPTFPDAIVLANLFGVTVDELLPGDSEHASM